MLLDLFRQRRSIRKFTGEAIEADKLEVLKEAALRPPSSMGIIPGSLSLSPTRNCWPSCPRPSRTVRAFWPAPGWGSLYALIRKNRPCGSKMRPLPRYIFSWRPNRWDWETAGFRSEKGCMMILNLQRPTSRSF